MAAYRPMDNRRWREGRDGIAHSFLRVRIGGGDDVSFCRRRRWDAGEFVFLRWIGRGAPVRLCRVCGAGGGVGGGWGGRGGWGESGEAGRLAAGPRSAVGGWGGGGGGGKGVGTLERGGAKRGQWVGPPIPPPLPQRTL